jgi:iron complex transport system substrate-binding protein
MEPGIINRRPMRNPVAAVVVSALAGMLVACGSSVPATGPAAASTTQPTPTTQVVTTISGAQVRVPLRVNRIAEQFPAHTATDIMLGAGGKLVAIPPNVKTLPFLRNVFPGIASVPELFQNGGGVNMEQLLHAKPDVVSAIDGGAVLTPFQAVGLPAVDMYFPNLSQLTQSITLAGQVYGGDAAKIAQQYNNYFDGNVELIQSRLANLPDSQRPTVLHIRNFPPLTINSGTSIVGQWIKLAGGTDVASGVNGTTITAEQVLKWNPDILIIQAPGGDQGKAANSAESVLKSLSAAIPGWDNLKAVKNHQVFFNPQGLYPWEQYGPEEALQILWAAKTLHLYLFKDVDMRTEAHDFYKTFFRYNVSDVELNQIFQNQ